LSIASLLTHVMDVEAIAASPPRDSSGGIDDSTWAAVLTAVPCVLTPLSAARMADFAIAGQKVDWSVVTEQEGIVLGQRLKVTDEAGVTTYLRVATVKRVRRRGGIGPFTEILGEEIRLQ
jgi:hypothetical protein